MLNINKIAELSELDVLYVEDDDETREELELVLQKWFRNLYSASNGQEGLDLYKQHQPAIVISDIQMPQKNGLLMSAEIKSINPNQEIVILSAYNDVEYLFKALELSIKHYITKPINLDRLFDKLFEIKQQMYLESEFKRSRKLLEQYKLLVDEKAIVAKIDLQGQISYVNQQFCKLSGYSEEELIGQHYLFTLASEQEAVLEELKSTALTNRKWQGMLKKTSKHGESYIVDVTVVAIVDSDNQIEEFVALMVDMTEIYEKFDRLSINMQQDLESNKHYLQEYERAIEIGTSLCVFNTDGEIINANKNFCATLDCHEDELIGRYFSEIVEECIDFKESIFADVQKHGFSSNVIRISAKPDYVRTLSTVIIGVHNESGDLHSLMSLSQDISESIKLNEEIIETQKELIYVMGEVVENRSHETGLHIKRVAKISQLLAEKYGLGSEYAQMIKIAAPMHDIGKVGIPDDILHKPGKLTPEEYQTMKGHANLGFQMLNKLDRPLINMAATIAYEHHEHYNGKGYPLGLIGDQIAIEARIVGLVDVFDALGSTRSYKKPWSDKKIIDYLVSNKGKQFDPDLIDLFIQNIDQIIEIRNQLLDKD